MIYEKMIQHFFCADIYYIMKISEQKRRRYGNLKKNILILAALIAVVLAVPFLIIKADEAIQIKNAEFKEKQNNVCYEKAGECMDAGEYDEAIELLEKLPGNYEDAEYIIRYAKFCKAVQNEEGIEELHKLIWNFPKEDKYSGKYAEEMKRVKEDTEVQYEKYMAQKEKEEEGPPMDLRINMLINATPNATMKIVMDPVAGDNITATGNGNLQVNYFNKGDFKMFGNYIIDQGMYKLSMQEVIRKDFTLKSGGTVTFTGDPYQANLDLQAIYTVNSASLSDLGIDTSLSQGQSTVKVNCLMNLTGNLSSPDIKFDLDLPTVREEDRDVVRSITSTEEQMNTQIIYLLGIGKFYTYDYANNDQSSNATSSLAFSTLSGQLNNMLSQWMDNKNWNIGANLSTGDKGWTDVEAEAVLSGRLLNNRLIINGNFGYKDNAMANTNFVGDFEAIWLLTKNGDFRLRGYNQTNDRYFTKSTLTTQGIGIMYKKDFDKWNDLFRWFLWKRAHKKKEKEDTTSSSPASQTKRNDN